MKCEKCGAKGGVPAVEDSDGRLWHFRSKEAFKDGKLHPIRCYGKFVEVKK